MTTLTDDDRRALVERARQLMGDGSSLSAAAAAVGIPESTLRMWAKRFELVLPVALAAQKQTARARASFREFNRARRLTLRAQAAAAVQTALNQLQAEQRLKGRDRQVQARTLQSIVTTLAILQDKDIADRLSGGSLPIEDGQPSDEDFTLEGQKRLDELAARRETA